MKRFISLILALCMMFVLCACETPQEKARREIDEATKAYNDAQHELDKLEWELDYVQSQIDRANGK